MWVIQWSVEPNDRIFSQGRAYGYKLLSTHYSTQRHTFFDSRDNSESNNDRHDGLYNTWNVSGVFVVNTILSMGLKSRFISFKDRIIGLIGEFPIF